VVVPIDQDATERCADQDGRAFGTIFIAAKKLELLASVTMFSIQV
jgi:hypothetical protein